MARVAGVDLPREKRGEVAVTYIYGIGRSAATRIMTKANVDPAKKVKAWSDDETARVRELIERELKVEGDLRREISMNVKRLMDIGSYRGIRHRKGLPVRGPRAPKKKGGKKRERREVRTGIAHVQATFNNTIVTLTDKGGNVVSWSSAGSA